MIGESLALGSAFAFAFGSVAIAKGAVRRSGESGVLLSVLMTGLLSGLAWLVAGLPRDFYSADIAVWAAIGWFAASGVLATVWGRLTLFKAIQYAGVVRASTVRRLTPFFSVLLAWMILNEDVSAIAGAGMAVIGFSFVLLIIDSRQRLLGERGGADISRGYAFGVVCAMSYAASYIVRKYGLIHVPDAFFGAFIGSVAAFAYYLVGCIFSAEYRTVVRQSLQRPDSWHLLAAVCISGGQIAQFAALTFADVSRVAMINSVEIYISAYLAVFVFKTEKRPSNLIVAATVLATAGVILVATG